VFAPALTAVGVGAGAGIGSFNAPPQPPPPPQNEEVYEPAPAPEPPPADEPRTLADIARAASLKAERAALEQTLDEVRWNRRKAAQQLGVSYKTLLNKIKECGISQK
jgi:DNA-binding NtrC family response regulator